jgi:NADH-quinone oxidoreductase subunit M
MNGLDIPWLSLLTFVPWAGALACALVARGSEAKARRLALGWSLAPLLLLGLLALSFRWDDAAALQAVERHAWMPALGVEYHLGVDGLGWLCLLLTALVVPFALALVDESTEKAGYLAALVLLLQGALAGTFTALNFVHWFLFWEVALVPAFFLVKQWGGAHRSAAAYQFFVYTMVGSAAMLVAMVAVWSATGSFDFPALARLAEDGRLAEALAAKGGPVWPMLAFGGVLLGLAVKVPLFPFHTWLPATYAEAPTPVTMMLTGVMSKMGVYGFLRVLLPLFPDQIQAAMPWLLTLAVAGIVTSAFAAMRQTDLKRMLAYSSINHLGYCLLAVFAVCGNTAAHGQAVTAMAGTMLQLFNHGVTAAVLFACVAMLEARSGGLRGIDDFGGLRAVCPAFAGLWGVAMFSSLGLPGLNGFVGEYLIFQGVFAIQPAAASVAALGLLFTAVFLLNFWRKAFHGPPAARWRSMRDLSGRERLLLAPGIALMFLLGVWPQALLGWINPVAQLLAPGPR